jgi:Beta-lactamase
MIGLGRAFGALALLAIATAGNGWAESVLPVAATPEDVSSSQLARIEAVTQKHIESGLVPGAVMLGARRGKVGWYKMMGFRDRAAKARAAAENSRASGCSAARRSGFGLGVDVRTSVGDSALPGSLGEYGWAGNAGTLFWIDPREQLIAIYMVQVNDGDRVMLRNQFRTMVQSAIIN